MPKNERLKEERHVLVGQCGLGKFFQRGSFVVSNFLWICGRGRGLIGHHRKLGLKDKLAFYDSDLSRSPLLALSLGFQYNWGAFVFRIRDGT